MKYLMLQYLVYYIPCYWINSYTINVAHEPSSSLLVSLPKKSMVLIRVLFLTNSSSIEVKSLTNTSTVSKSLGQNIRSGCQNDTACNYNVIFMLESRFGISL